VSVAEYSGRYPALERRIAQRFDGCTGFLYSAGFSNMDLSLKNDRCLQGREAIHWDENVCNTQPSTVVLAHLASHCLAYLLLPLNLNQLQKPEFLLSNIRERDR